MVNWGSRFIVLMVAASAIVGAQTPPVRFTDVTQAAGIAFRHTTGAAGKKYLPETMGAGCAFVDVDSDGFNDILFVNGRSLAGKSIAGGGPALVLYRNNRNGTFTDVTQAAGLAVPEYGMGVTAADYDNDGWQDLYLTALGGNRLFRNLGNGRFSDVTATAGVSGGGFSTSAVFFDYDKDGRLDLYAATYVKWSIAKDLFCTLDGKTKSYCTPESYEGDSGRLYRNRGNGTFEDVTVRAGLFDSSSKGLGVAVLDYDEDGWIDLFVAHDTQPNRLYRNKGDGAFVDVALSAGVAFGETGVARAGMGVDAADYSGTGRASLVIGNFSNEMIGLYHNEGNGLFVDEAPASAVGRESLLRLAFATMFFDADLDGRLDIFAANGHVADDIAAVQPKVTYAQPPLLFRNLGNRTFQDVVPAAGADLARPVVGRGAAYGDYDNDGDLDLLVTANNGPARLLRNDPPPGNGFLRVRVRGSSSNRDGIGAKVTVTVPGGEKRWRLVHTGSSYCSRSELTLTFGLGSHPHAESIEVAWPSGRVDRIGRQGANQTIAIEEGKGLVKP